jgi:small subunit ribosomal protein S17
MSDEEKKDTAEETQAEGSEASAAGPVAGEGSSSSQAAGEEPTPTPPAEEDSEAKDETPSEEVAEPPAAEEAEPEAPAEEPAAKEAAPEAEPDPEDDLPWKEKKRLEASRKPHRAKPQQTVEERKAERLAGRKLRAAQRRKERAAAKAKKSPGTGTPPAERSPNAAKVRQGIVVSDKGQKSITVRIDTARRHPTYEKVVRRSRTLHAHDERNEAGEGDVVRVIETRPLSKTKRWRLVEVLEKAK